MKIASTLLALTLILASAAGCAAENNTGNTTDTAAADATSENQTKSEDTRILSDAPVNDYGGVDFRIISKESNTSNHHWDARDIDTDAETGDVINDAVYRRNLTIEERYNINIVKTESADPEGLAKKAVLAESDEYDIMFANQNGAVGLAQSGYLFDLNKIPYIDLVKPWYDQNSNAQLSVNGKLYTTFCDFTILDKDATWVYLFNKQLLQDLSLEDPYKLVRDGEWTIDKLTEMCVGASKDLDGDGVLTWRDQYGWEGETWNMYAGIVAADVVMIPKNSDDLPVYAGLGERGLTAFTKLLNLFGNKNLCLRVEDITGVTGDLWVEVMDKSFMEGRVLFNNAGMNRVSLFRGMDIDFGVLPSPKLDSSQEYYCNTVTGAPSLAVLGTVRDLDKIGMITDALCAESKYTLIPAYYNVQLKTKLSRDNDSAEMFDIIFASRRFDLALTYGWGELSAIFANAMKSNNSGIISVLEKREVKIQAAIDKTITAYQDLD
ncbi:hypothetical protein FACS1894219_01720 [Clostridia bacterium]|nr:hypothetical protein FACS1894219_01720 [Clostridia bacterium]